MQDSRSKKVEQAKKQIEEKQKQQRKEEMVKRANSKVGAQYGAEKFKEQFKNQEDKVNKLVESDKIPAGIDEEFSGFFSNDIPTGNLTEDDRDLIMYNYRIAEFYSDLCRPNSKNEVIEYAPDHLDEKDLNEKQKRYRKYMKKRSEKAKRIAQKRQGESILRGRTSKGLSGWMTEKLSSFISIFQNESKTEKEGSQKSGLFSWFGGS